MGMVDITKKPVTKRTALAEAKVFVKAETLKCISLGTVPKGDVIECAKTAGLLAAKNVPHLIPMCHPLNITGVDINITPDPDSTSVHIKAEVSVLGRTGVEMEALAAAGISALTIYDMCKQIDKDMVIGGIRLLKKTGGKSGRKEGWNV